jgi:hypothetical protein
MLRIVQQIPEALDQGLLVGAGDQQVITNPITKAVVAAMCNKATMVAGTVAVTVDKEADPMARAAVAAEVAVVMANNNSIKANKGAILDSFEHSSLRGEHGRSFRDTQLG